MSSSWSELDLTVVATSEGLTDELVMTVCAPIVERRDGRRFVVRDVRVANPEPNIFLAEPEFREEIEQGGFAEIPRWRARRFHVVVFLRQAVQRKLRELHAHLDYAESTMREDGWLALYVNIHELARFRQEAAKALQHQCINRLKSSHSRAPTGAEEDELHQWIRWSAAVCARDSAEELQAALLWIVAQKRFNTGRTTAARAAALRLRGLTPESLDDRLREVEPVWTGLTSLTHPEATPAFGNLIPASRGVDVNEAFLTAPGRARRGEA